MTPRGVDFYAFQAAKGKRFVVECAARGIDSKLNPVLIIADAQGRDLLADRRGGLLDFKAPADGKYFVKVHDLTFQGGPAHFYRLALLEEPGTGPAPRQPATTTVSSFSWVPDEASKLPKVAETEPNNQHAAGAEDHAPLRDRGPVLSGRGRRHVRVRRQEGRRVVGGSRVGATRLAHRSLRPRAARDPGRFGGEARRRRGVQRYSQPDQAVEQRLLVRRPGLRRRVGGRPRQARDQGRRGVSPPAARPVRRHAQRGRATSTG